MEMLVRGAIAAFIFALGASVGSFLNVVIYRLPAGLSILWPPSRCPHCLHQLGKGENIPILGWLWLRGKCLKCKTPISVRYPVVEAITGLFFVAVYGFFGLSLETLGYWALISWLLALAIIDLDTLTLPNPLTQSGLVAGLLFMIVIGLRDSAAIAQLMAGILGAVLGIWLFDGIRFLGSVALGKTAMGAGDAKLAAMLGAWLGWKSMLLAGFLGCVLGALVGGGAIAFRLLDRGKAIPFGPFLALGAILTVFWGDAILSTYFQLFFPLSLR